MSFLVHYKIKQSPIIMLRLNVATECKFVVEKVSIEKRKTGTDSKKMNGTD